MTKKEWDDKCDEIMENEDSALRSLFLVLAHQYAHPQCDDQEDLLDATWGVVEAWHEKMEHFDKEPATKPINPILRIVE
jgi:hypothetical protein